MGNGFGPLTLMVASILFLPFSAKKDTANQQELP
jgi:hypothetical protein